MEPNQDELENTQNVSDSTQSESDNMQKVSDESTYQNGLKKKNGMLIGIILLAVLAAGGIGFGIWAIMNGNDAKLNSKITTLEQQNNELEEKITELEGGDFEEDEEFIDDEEIAYDEDVDEDEDSDEGGYLVYSIGDCVADSGTAASPVTIIKCDAITSEGNGKFVYDSESNTLKFVLD